MPRKNKNTRRVESVLGLVHALDYHTHALAILASEGGKGTVDADELRDRITDIRESLAYCEKTMVLIDNE